MTAVHKQMTNAEYHADRSADSWTSLKCFEDNPLVYRNRYVTQTSPMPEPSDSMVKGQMCHTILAGEPEWWVEQPEFIKVRRGEAWEMFLAEAVGRGVVPGEWAIVKPSFIVAANEMAKGIRDNPAAMKLIDMAARTEESIFWEHSTGLRLKCRFDIAGLDFVGDFKCVSDPASLEFSRQIHRLMYYRQAALYSAGFKAAWDILPHFYFIAVRNEEPWDSYVYKLDRNAIREGAECNRLTLERLAKAKATGDYRPQGWGVVNDIDMQVYAYHHMYHGE